MKNLLFRILSWFKQLTKLRKAFVIIALVIALHWVYMILLILFFPPITTTQINSIFEGYSLQRDYVCIDQISPEAALAVLAAEDQTFMNHFGIDLESIEKAIEHNKKKHKRKHGASTISQQVAKNIFLWQGRSWFRKGLEVYFTFMIELLWTKERILEMYLNTVEMGEGIFGIEAAARQYFKKSARFLTREEAAMIAASLPNPKKYRVKPMSAWVMLRKPWIVEQMNHLEYDEDIKQLINGMYSPKRK